MPRLPEIVPPTSALPILRTWAWRLKTAATWTAVPEPTTALAGLLLTAGLLRRRR